MKQRNVGATGEAVGTVGLGGLVFGLIDAGALGLGHPRVLIALGIGAASLGGFVFAETRVASPMMPLSLFRSRTFVGANLLTFFLYAALGGTLFFLPFNLIQVQGYTATAAGAGRRSRHTTSGKRPSGTGRAFT